MIVRGQPNVTGGKIEFRRHADLSSGGKLAGLRSPDGFVF